MEGVFDITEFGAVGDEKTDCTKAIREALAQAGKCRGVVIVPPGRYLCGEIRIPEGVTLSGFPAWSFRQNGSSVLVLNDPNAECLVDVTGGYGCTLHGICLDGKNLGACIHGVSIKWQKHNGGDKEDTPTIEDCRISEFTGNGVNFKNIWCFSVRHSMLCFNGGHGLFIDGWDGFIIDNWFSGNKGAGLCGEPVAASVTATGNRVEWNGKTGFYLRGANSFNITGNYFDRSCGPAIRISGDQGSVNSDITVTGNVIYRSGKPRPQPFDSEYENSQVWAESCVNLVMSGNTVHMGTDDGGGVASPDYGFVLKTLKTSVIKDNVMEKSCRKQCIVDLGEHRDGVIIKDNVGSPHDGDDIWQTI